jgi:cytochrome b6-f complex iron-sulfur subunit
MQPQTDRAPTPGATLWSRRDLLTGSGWAAVLATLGLAALGSARMLRARVRAGPRSLLVLGPPDELAVGEVSTRHSRSHQLVVVRSAAGIYALSTVCTHLGCVLDFEPAARLLACPCHGARFDLGGDPLVGPASRPLERLSIHRDDTGRLLVDTSVHLARERGDWNRPDALFAYPAERQREHG